MIMIDQMPIIIGPDIRNRCKGTEPFVKSIDIAKSNPVNIHSLLKISN